MEYFSVDGDWWLPSSPHHRTSGTISFDVDGLTFTAFGSLAAPPQGPIIIENLEWNITPVIYGRTKDGRKVTLLEATGFNVAAFAASRSTYGVWMALFDVHTERASFVEAWSEFDSLYAWVNPPALPVSTGNDGEFTYRTQNQTIADTGVGNTEVRLVDCPIGRHDQAEISYRQHVYFVLKFQEIHGRDVLQRWIRPLQDLLILSTGRPARLTSLLLRPADAEPDQTLAEGYFAAVQPRPTQPPDWASLEANTSGALLTLANSPLPFDVLMSNWFRIRTQFAEVFTLLHSPSYVDSMFNEHRFASLFQSAEALASAVGLSGREKSRAEHRQRVARIGEAALSAGVDSETIEWAKRVLVSRNDKPLWKQIHDLIYSTGRVGQRVLAASPDFATIVTSARTGVSHGGASRKLNPTDRHWYGEVLRWIVRARLLVELGVGQNEIERRIDRRASFQFSLDRLTEPSA